MPVSWSIALKWFFQFCFVCTLIILGLELSARWLLPDNIDYWHDIYLGDQRYAFISKGVFQNKIGYFNFRPNSKIRTIAYYPDSQGKLTVEYDCTYQSDKLGFVSNNRDYQETNILLLGDSFTQGDGGCAWIPRLNPAIRSQIYSTAVMGLGVLHWGHIVSDLETLKKPKKILIIFITDDFFRTDWIYDRKGIECVNEGGDCTASYWYPISDNLSEVAAQRFNERNRPKGLMQYLKYNLIATYSIYKIITGSGNDKDQLFKQSLVVVSELAKKYHVKFLWVNEKNDNDRSSVRSTEIARELKAFNVTRCDIPRDGFLPRNLHPNALGYDVLKTCVEDTIHSW